MKQDSSNKDNILACARRLFFEKGYDSVGVQEIVDTAGITKPTMYYYYKSKQGLLESMMEEGARKMLEELRTVTTREGDFSENLRLVAQCYIKVALGNKELFLLLVSLFSSAKDNEAFRTAKPYIAEFIDLMKEFFERYSQSEIPQFKGREDYLAISFTGIMDMYIMVAFERDEMEQVEKHKELVDNICRQFMPMSA